MHKQQTRKILAMGLLVFLFLVYLIFLERYIKIPCFFHLFTGYYCPGCGITRCLKSILELDFYQAFRYNNLVFILLPVFIIYFLESLLDYLKIKHLNLKRYFNNKFFSIVLIITIIYGICRSIDFFNYLIPTAV